MKRLLVAGFALALLVPACAMAQSVFNGTWKLDPTTIHVSGGQPLAISLKDGMFSRTNAKPPFSVKADGRDHAVKGHKDFDTAAVTVVNDHTTREIDKKAGKVVADVTFTVAPNGKTGTVEGTEYRGSTPMMFKEVMKRVAKGPTGANAVNGSWRMDHIASLSDNAANSPTFKVVGDTVTASDATGDGYTAKIGGKPVPNMMNGKADGTVAVKMLGKNTLRETYAKNGKVTETSTMTILADGKTMKMVDHDPASGRTSTMLHRKQ